MTLEIYSKLTFIHSFVKTFLLSVTLLITSTKNQGITKQQDEYAFFKMVEHLIKFSLSDKDSYPLLLSVKYFMHKNFLTLKQQEGTLAALKAYIAQKKEAGEVSEAEYSFLTLIVSKIEEKVKGTTKKSPNQTVNETKAVEAEEGAEEEESKMEMRQEVKVT